MLCMFLVQGGWKKGLADLDQNCNLKPSPVEGSPNNPNSKESQLTCKEEIYASWMPLGLGNLLSRISVVTVNWYTNPGIWRYTEGITGDRFQLTSGAILGKSLLFSTCLKKSKKIQKKLQNHRAVPQKIMEMNYAREGHWVYKYYKWILVWKHFYLLLRTMFGYYEVKILNKLEIITSEMGLLYPHKSWSM